MCHVTVKENFGSLWQFFDLHLHLVIIGNKQNVHQHYFSYNNIQILCYYKREKCVRVNVLYFWVCIHKWYCPVLQQWRWRDRDYSHDTPQHSTGDNTPDWLQDSKHKKKAFILIHTSLEAQTLLLLKVKCVIPVLLVAVNRFAKYSDYF